MLFVAFSLGNEIVEVVAVVAFSLAKRFGHVSCAGDPLQKASLTTSFTPRSPTLFTYIQLDTTFYQNHVERVQEHRCDSIGEACGTTISKNAICHVCPPGELCRFEYLEVLTVVRINKLTLGNTSFARAMPEPPSWQRVYIGICTCVWTTLGVFRVWVHRSTKHISRPPSEGLYCVVEWTL